MESWIKMDRNLREKSYTNSDLLRYLNQENEGVLYNTFVAIAESKPEDMGIIERVKQIASGTDKLSQRGVPGASLRMVAIATLKSLGMNDFYENLTDDEKLDVKGIYYQESWPK
ncbi:hypothetical protein [Listeria costaricensis]|uniref:hypothetical protein n=1 Tax=Listeria costaricensis TaxID=2026604 RepID=UPI000C068D19|nr:hypothetical protein [Listeria costaricensis]